MEITGLTKLRWISGQKLVCVNDKYAPEDAARFSAPLVAGVVYVVREPVFDVVFVIGVQGEFTEDGREYGHHYSRFVELHGKKD